MTPSLRIQRQSPVLLFPRGRGVSVQPVNEYEMYELATLIHPLTTINENTKYSESWWTLWQARQILNDTFVSRRPLSFSRPAGSALHAAVGTFLPERWEDAIAKYPTPDKPEDPALGWLAHAIREAAKNFETILAAET